MGLLLVLTLAAYGLRRIQRPVPNRPLLVAEARLGVGLRHVSRGIELRFICIARGLPQGAIIAIAYHVAVSALRALRPRSCWSVESADRAAAPRLALVRASARNLDRRGRPDHVLVFRSCSAGQLRRLGGGRRSERRRWLNALRRGLRWWWRWWGRR